MSPVYSVSRRMWIANMLIVVALLVSCIIPTAAVAVAPGAPRAQEADLAQRAADIAARYGVDVQLILEMVEAGVPIEIIDPNVIDAYLSESTGEPQLVSASDSWQRYEDSVFGISFDYPASWNVRELVDPEEEVRELEIYDNNIGEIVINRTNNSEQLTPHGWFEMYHNRYHREAIVEIAEIEIDGNQALVLGQADTCQTVAMITVILGYRDSIFTFAQYESTASRTHAYELGKLLDTISFDTLRDAEVSLLTPYMEFPDAPPGIICPEIRAAANSRICSGADMYIPSEGEMRVPWKCFNDDPYCSPYKTRPENDPACGEFRIFCNPHSGIDIFGGAGSGVTPVYATYNGTARLTGDSAVRINFDSPYSGYSAYMTHMATSHPNYQDFRSVTNGSKVVGGDTLIGRQGDYGTGAGVHLHLSYSDRGTDLWPTLNPATFLKAKNLEYYAGWSHVGHAVACEDSSAIDVALIIDSSGSMTWNDPQNQRKDAAKVFIDAMQNEDLAAVIDFDHITRVAWQLQKVGADRSGPKAAVDTIDSNGGTDVGAGLQTGYNSLLTSTNGNAKAAVLLTDGRGNYNNQADLYKQKGWKVYTIGLGSDVDANLLTRIANETGGKYFPLSNPNQLVQVYFEILGAVAEGTTVRNETVRLDPQQTKTVAVNLPAGQTSANFLTTWQGSTVDTKLIAPDGAVITPDTPATDPNVAHSKGLTFELYRVTNPQPGDWQIEVYGADLPTGGEDVSVTVAVRGLEGYFNAYINAPTEVSCANTAFTAEAWVVNDTNTTFLTGTATISLPVGLVLAGGQASQQSLGVVLQGSQVKSEWSLIAAAAGVTQTLPYTVVTIFEQGPGDPMVALGAVQVPQCVLAPATASLSAAPNKIIANGVSTSTITVVLQDINGLPVPNATANFTASLGVITNAATTNANGSASVTLRSATTTGIATITTAAGVAAAATQVEFIPGAPHQVAVSASPTTLVADGVSAGAVVALLRDEHGNVIPNHVVSFSTTLGQIGGSAITNGEGKATTTLTSAVTSGVATVTASAGSASGSATVAFAAGSPSKLALTANPPQAVADGASTITVEASIADAFDNPVSGQVVAFTTTLGSISGGVTTNALGKAATLLTAPKTRGVANVTASLDGMSKTLQVSFTAGAPALVTVSATPGHIAADGESTSSIVAIVADANGNRADGREVKFSTTLGSIQPTGVTNTDGVATAIFTSDAAAGVAVVTAEAGQASGQTTVTMSSPTALPVTEEPDAATARPHIYLPLVVK